MVFPSNQDDVPHGFASSEPFQSTTGPSAPLPPSRRQRDTDAQWVMVLVVAVITIVGVALVLAIRPGSRDNTPAPRAPSTYSQHDCDYQYLSCPTTTGWPR